MLGIEDWKGSERVERFKEQIEVIDRLLRQNVSSYDGKFYKLNEATMNPPTIQKPRPPLTIAAMGDSMLRIAAQYADTWNSFGSEDWRAPKERIFENTRNRIKLIEKFCEEIGRNPEKIHHSLLFYSRHGRTLLDSKDIFKSTIKRYVEIGINEFIIYYPFYDSKQIQNIKIIANQIIPGLR